jgi:hypothetical protein
MANVSLLVSVSEDYLSRMPEIVQTLASIGMTNIQSMEAVGVITGSLDDSKVSDLSDIEGVAQVKPSQEIQIPPPDSEIQ